MEEGDFLRAEFPLEVELARFTLYSTYRDISLASVEAARRIQADIAELETGSGPEAGSASGPYGRAALDGRLEREKVIATVFAAMCLEAFIFEYAASYTSSGFTNAYLDKLDVIGKWVVIPQLVTGREFPRDSPRILHVSGDPADFGSQDLLPGG